MAQIVIEIPDSKYQSILDDDYCGLLDADLYKAIHNGTPLPEGHGRLIDADALKHKFISYGYDYGKDELDEASTIIEADRGV